MRIYCLAFIAFLAPRGAGAQTTADGVQALVRGDYATAVRILRPLADLQQADPLAQFFMATLYQSGRGVESNPIHACGLYLRAATPGSPVLIQALALARTIHRDMSVVLDSLLRGKRRRLAQPALGVVHSGTNHWVRIDRTGITVGHEGTQKIASTVMGGFGWLFLPFRHTQLDVSWPVEARRHFIEAFFWMPTKTSDQPGWDLKWTLFEVVGPQLVPVAGDRALATIAGAQPPAAFEGAAVGVHVNAKGEAEWVVLGPKPRTGVIPYNPYSGPR